MYIYDVMLNDSVKPFSCKDILSLTDKGSVLAYFFEVQCSLDLPFFKGPAKTVDDYG
jgi:hypothetical protein